MAVIPWTAAIEADPERMARMHHVLLTAGKGLPEAASVSDPRGTIAETDEKEGTP